jgi:hypothetical protein
LIFHFQIYHIITKKICLSKTDRKVRNILETEAKTTKDPIKKKADEQSLIAFDNYIYDNTIVIISTPNYADYVHKSYDELKKLEGSNISRLSGLVIIS